MFILNGLTIVTELIGILPAVNNLGVSKVNGVVMAAVLTMLRRSSGKAEFGDFTDAGDMATGLGKHVSLTIGVLFAIT